jgi:3-methyladenine DNA glycosylase/8-oxoguanine DNA glycosylase
MIANLPWIHLARRDPVMNRLVKLHGPQQITAQSGTTTFSGLTRSIIGQQLSGKAARTIYSRFTALFPKNGHLDPFLVSKKSTAQLRAVGLSQAKARYVLELAEHAKNEKIPSVSTLKRMSDEQAFEALTQFNGVGPWTAEMILIFLVGRPNILPLADAGVQRGFQIAYAKKKGAKLERYFEIWNPHCSTASLYLWKVADGGGV